MVDAGLEIIPPEVKKFPSVKKYIAKFGDAGRILDNAYHHGAMARSGLKDMNARGRPDIVHHFLIDTLSSPLNKWNILRVYVHTRVDNRLYEFNPIIRPPKSYHRFKGVMYKLLKQGVLKITPFETIEKNTVFTEDSVKEAPPKFKKWFEPYNHYLKAATKPGKKDTHVQREHGPPPEFIHMDHFVEYDEIVLARKMRKSINAFIGYLKPHRVIRLNVNGKMIPSYRIFEETDPDEHIVVLVGGFQGGEFSYPIRKIRAEDISIFPFRLESWAVYQRVLISYENTILRKYVG